MEKFVIGRNDYLSRNTTGYYHQLYTGYKKPGNPDFVNTLKNTFNDESRNNLTNARDKVIDILMEDLPVVIKTENMFNCMVVCVPRAKNLESYSDNQLMFKEAVRTAANNTYGVFDGTDCIIRHEDTKTTHLMRANITNDGCTPYPGITVDTCTIDREIIEMRDIILIDDIYTRTINIDEDCIQALYDNGVNSVIFYSIGYTRRF